MTCISCRTKPCLNDSRTGPAKVQREDLAQPGLAFACRNSKYTNTDSTSPPATNPRQSPGLDIAAVNPPISSAEACRYSNSPCHPDTAAIVKPPATAAGTSRARVSTRRSAEHTSELQSARKPARAAAAVRHVLNL